MKRFSAHFMSFATVLLLGTVAQAGPIPPDKIQWQYNFNPGAPALFADGNPGASVSFTNEPTKTAKGSSDIVATNLRVSSAGTAEHPDKLVNNGAYALTLQLIMNDNGNP